MGCHLVLFCLNIYQLVNIFKSADHFIFLSCFKLCQGAFLWDRKISWCFVRDINLISLHQEFSGYNLVYRIHHSSFGPRICGSFFLLLSFFLSKVFNFFRCKHHYVFDWNYYVTYTHIMFFFTHYLFLNNKRCHLTTFSWQLQNQSERKSSAPLTPLL